MVVMKVNKFTEINLEIYYRIFLRFFGVIVYYFFRQFYGMFQSSGNFIWCWFWSKVFFKVKEVSDDRFYEIWWYFLMYDELFRGLNFLKLVLEIMGVLEKLMYFRVKILNFQGIQRRIYQIFIGICDVLICLDVKFRTVKKLD